MLHRQVARRKTWERVHRRAAATSTLAIFQPPDRIDVFQWIEVGIFVAVGVAALALAFALLRGRRVWV